MKTVMKCAVAKVNPARGSLERLVRQFASDMELWERREKGVEIVITSGPKFEKAVANHCGPGHVVWLTTGLVYCLRCFTKTTWKVCEDCNGAGWLDYEAGVGCGCCGMGGVYYCPQCEGGVFADYHLANAIGEARADNAAPHPPKTL